MAHKLKALGLALVAVFAMSAVMSSSASAAGEFEVEKVPATITGEQITGKVTEVDLTKHEFKTTAGIIKCTPVTFEGSATATLQKALKLTATYGNTTEKTGCTLAGVAAPVVHMKSCFYELTAGNTIEPFATTKQITAITHIKCGTAGDEIEITAGATCTITVPPQTFPESMVTLENSGGAGSAMDIKAFIDIKEIAYMIDGAGCPNSAVSHTGAKGTATAPDGEYKGVATLKAEDPITKAAIGITVR